MGNMDVWSKVNRPPADALKKIEAGRLKGKSDINPQWRLQIMTETFGTIGIGWKYVIIDKWITDANLPEKIAHVQIDLYIKDGDKWSEPIPGIGGSMYIAAERGGYHANDEAYKMALTDALSVAMKQLGVAADIYRGLWDGSKYRNIDDQTVTTQTKSQEIPIENLQENIRQMLILMRNNSVAGYESNETIQRTLLKEIKVNNVSLCKDRRKLEEFEKKMSHQKTQQELVLMLAKKGYNDDELEQLAQNVIGCPLSACFDDERLIAMRKEIMKLRSKNE
ncbi:MAG TPA: hypothetical protein PLD62_11310 [Candidatus Cloacimonadota bacterium]|nr:hypothetical protein [Candidatus Cloacimonadota bacterium]